MNKNTGNVEIFEKGSLNMVIKPNVSASEKLILINSTHQRKLRHSESFASLS